MTSSSSSVPMYNLILRIIQVAWWSMQVLGADEYEEDKILSYIKERSSNERWISSSSSSSSSASSASSASSVDSEISEQSTIWSPGGEQLPTERPLYCNKLSTTPQALLGAALTPEGRDPCSQIGIIRMCNHSSHPHCRNGESNSMPLNIYIHSCQASNHCSGMVQNIWGNFFWWPSAFPAADPQCATWLALKMFCDWW